MCDPTRLNPVHPGEILEADFMVPFGLSVGALARAIGIGPTRLNDIVRGRRRITAENALRLARYFGTDADSWLNLQNRYELAVAEQEAGLEIRQIRPLAVYQALTPVTSTDSVSRQPVTGRRWRSEEDRPERQPAQPA